MSFSIKCPHLKMYKMNCEQIFPIVQLPYRFRLLALQSYFEAFSFPILSPNTLRTLRYIFSNIEYLLTCL